MLDRVVGRAGLFGSGSGLKLTKNFGLNSCLRRAFCLRCTKIYTKELGNIANCFRSNFVFGFFRTWFELQINFRVRAGFGLIFSGSSLTLVLGVPPLDPQWSPVDGGETSRPSKQPSLHRKFLVERLILNVCWLHFKVLKSYYEKLMS